MGYSRLGVAIFAACLSSGTALAQVPVRAPIQGCELHVWLTPSMHSQFHGAFALGGTIYGTLTPQERSIQAMKAILTPEVQRSIIESQVISDSSPFKGYRIIVHDAPAKSKFENWLDKHIGDGPRETDSGSQCYSELHLVALSIYETTIYKQLGIIYVFRQFGSSPTAVRSVRDAVATRPSGFKTTRAVQSEEGALALKEAFQRGIARLWEYKKLR